MTSEKTGDEVQLLPARNGRTGDRDAALLFEYRALSVPRTFRIVENTGKFWLGAYVIPALIAFLGWGVWYLPRHWNAGYAPLPAGAVGLATMLLATCSAIVLGFISIWRGESKSYYAYQALICAVLLLLYAAVWALTVGKI